MRKSTLLSAVAVLAATTFCATGTFAAETGAAPVTPQAATTAPTSAAITKAVSYTHLDVYKRQEVPLDDRDRMQQAVETVASHITLDWKEPLLSRIEERRLSPPAFQHTLVERARKANKRIILPEGNEPRTIEAAIICHQRGIARCVLTVSYTHLVDQIVALRL